jgi:LysM repeat protein
MPADIVFTYQRVDGYEHIFVVTEVDANGRAYSVSNYPLKSGSFMVQRVLLYDPADPTVGVLKADWVQDTKTGRTGMAGFDVLRQKGVTLPPGSRYTYTIKPGDTLATIAPAFNTTVEAVLADNPLANPYALAVGQKIVVTLGAEPKRDGPAPTPQPTATEPKLPYDVSALAKVVLTSRVQGGRVRSEPNGVVIAAVRDGDPVQVLFGKRLVDNILWLQVRLENGITGWMAGFLLQMTDLNPTR